MQSIEDDIYSIHFRHYSNGNIILINRGGKLNDKTRKAQTL